MAQDKFATAVQSLFVLDPPSTLAVFGSLKQLRLGLETLKELLGSYESVLAPAEGPRGLKAQAHMECTVRMPRNLLLAAEVKVPVLGIADGPAAIAGQEREHRLPLSRRNYHVVVSERSRRALIYAHK